VMNPPGYSALLAERERLRAALTAAISTVGKYDDDDVPGPWRVALDPNWVRPVDE